MQCNSVHLDSAEGRYQSRFVPPNHMLVNAIHIDSKNQLRIKWVEHARVDATVGRRTG
jgi:hypothetical protein